MPPNAMKVAVGLIETSPKQACHLAISTTFKGDRWLWTYVQKGNIHSMEQKLSLMSIVDCVHVGIFFSINLGIVNWFNVGIINGFDEGIVNG